MRCPHTPQCPPVERADREAARVLAGHPEQGWSLLCNGVIAFDDTGELLPDGSIVVPHRGTAPAQSMPSRQRPRDTCVPHAAGHGTAAQGA